MNPKIKKLLIFSVLLVLIAGISVAAYLSKKVVYNDDDVSGNTTGNLNNGGLFCEYNGLLYFANPADNYCLYSMLPDCTNVTKLNNDSVCSLNVAGNYIYYVRDNISRNNMTTIFQGLMAGVIRTGLDGQNPFTLYTSAAGVVTLSGNYIYYQRYAASDGLSFCRVRIDGTDNTKLSDDGYFPVSIYDDSLYYTNVTNNHNIYKYDLATGISSLYITANAYLTDMQGDYIYYIDLDDNYSLVRVNTNSKEKQILTDKSAGRCISYNIYGNRIFYHMEGDSPALYCMNTDGSNNTLVFNGNITNISCTSQYTFFQQFNSDELYRVPTTGEPIVEQIVLQ